MPNTNVGAPIAQKTVVVGKPLVNIQATRPLSSLFDVKSLEKLAAWAAGVVAATNGFAQWNIPTTIREWIMGGAAIILAGIHISTPS